MAEIIPSTAPAPISVLGFDGTDFYVLKLDSDGHLQIDVQTSALPTGAATLAEQQTQTATLELIALIRNALQSVATDRLKVRGEDQLFTFKASLDDRVYKTNADVVINWLISTEVPAGEVWVVTRIVLYNDTSNTTALLLFYDAEHPSRLIDQALNPPARTPLVVSTPIILEAGTDIVARLDGCTAGDDIYLMLYGYTMTAEV